MKIHYVLAASCLVRTALSFQVAPPSSRPSWVLASSAEDSTEPSTGEKVGNLVQDDGGEGLIMASSAAEGSITELVQDDGGEGLIMASSAAEDSNTKEKVGNLVQDDEWEGLGMELSELVRTAVLQDLKTNAREFLGYVCICFTHWKLINCLELHVSHTFGAGLFISLFQKRRL
jgi:hypothetical protein